MADYRASLRLDLGPVASLDAIAAAFADLRIAIDFAQNSQAIIDRNDAAYSVLRRRDFGPILDDFEFAPGFIRDQFLASLLTSGSPLLSSPAFERAVEQRMRELQLDRVVRVERLTYSNPFDLNVIFSGEGIARILGVFRDWGPNRREASANARAAEARAREAEARATSYEDDQQFKRDVHDEIRKAFADGSLRIGPREVEGLVTKEVEGAVGRLLGAGLEAEVQAHPDNGLPPA